MIKKQPNIEGAWRAYLSTVMHPDAPEIQRNECRLAFWAGAATLFYGIMDCLDPGSEPTDADMKRMDNIHKEIQQFAKTFDAEVLKRKANGQA